MNRSADTLLLPIATFWPYIANATLAECCELIDEMRTIYSSSDDAVAVREARTAFGGLRAALDQRQGSLAASIRGACDPPSLTSGHVHLRWRSG